MPRGGKRRLDEPYKYQHLQNQLLTLHFAGVYITSGDMLKVASKVGYEMPYKSREFTLKTLFVDSEKDGKFEDVCGHFMTLINSRIDAYKKLTINYPKINEVSSLWIQKANTVQRLLMQQKRGNPYG